MRNKIVISSAFCMLLQLAATAQKGIPPRDVVNINTTTHYAGNLEFKPEMVQQLKAPAGYNVMVAASGLGKPRMLYTAPGGRLYVTRRDAGDVLLLTNAKDGKFDDAQIAVADFKGVHGITIKGDWMYLCNNNELRRYKILPDGLADDASKQILFDDMPSGGQHSNRTIEFGPDGLLYITVGSLCNDCVGDKETATILTADPANWKRSMFASGLRNTIGFDWQPASGELWGFDNGSDFKGDNWPPEELNKIEKGADYGFPFAYGKREVDKTREDPAGNTKEEIAKASMPSAMEFPAHSAPIAFKFLRTGPYAGDGIVCWHGSWNASDPVGYKVERVIFKDGKPVGKEDFLTGFLTGNKDRFGRPAGLAINDMGTIYVSDDANGVIYALQPKK